MKTKITAQHFIKALFLTAVFVLAVSPALAAEITSENIIKYVNQSRAEEGLADLAENEKLTAAAEDKLDDIIKNRYFAHTSPAGTSPWFWFEKNGYDYQYAGENLAINFTVAEDQHEAWMKSPTHRKNILNSNYEEIGVAVGAGEIEGQVSIIAVQEFGARSGAAEAPAGGRNFSTDNETDLSKENEKITPQVLSVKDSLPEKMDVKNIPVLKESGAGGKTAFLDLAFALAMILFAATLALIPMAFMAVAFEKIMVLRKGKEMMESA